jgi:hypothetical protein
MIHMIGRLSRNTITQLKEICEKIKVTSVLELSNLRSADAAGIESMQTLRDKGTEIRGASPFMLLLLDDE